MMPDIETHHGNHYSGIVSIILLAFAGLFHLFQGFNFGAFYDLTFKILALTSVVLSITINVIKLLRKPRK